MKISATISPNAPMDDPILFRGDFAKTIPLAAKLGYDGVELHMSDPQDFDCRHIMRLCCESSIAISSLATGSNCARYGFSLSSPSREIRDKTVACIKRYIDLGHSTGACVIIGLIKGWAKEHPSYADYEETLAESLWRCAEYAEPKGVELVLEAINRYESDSLNTLASVTKLIDKIGAPSLKLHIDTFHMNIEEDNLAESLLAAQSHIGHAHYVDNTLKWPGSGMIDFRLITTILQQTGYSGYYAIECLPSPDESSAAASALRYLRSLDM